MPDPAAGSQATAIHAAASPGELRVAALHGDRLLDYAIDRDALPRVGDLHRGRVTARVPAMAGAFVAIAGADGFLPDSEGGAVPSGTVLVVRITRAPQGGKGPRLSAREVGETAGNAQAAPVLLARGDSAVLRLAALHPAATVAVDDTLVLAALRPVLGARVRLVPNAFDDALEADIAALTDRISALPGGATMSVHATPALTAIDVDLAAATAGRGAKTLSHEAANRAALPAIAAQIRLRNLAGAILLDLAGLSPKRRAAFAALIRDALAADPLQPRFLGFSHLGLAEILRPRLHAPLAELLSGPHAAGLAALRQAVREQAARPGLRPILHVPPSIAAALRADSAAAEDYRRRTGHPMSLHEDRGLPPDGWRIEDQSHG